MRRSHPCRYRGPLILAGAIALLGGSARTAIAAPLPQRHPYQKILRDYFATLTEADFAVALQPVAFVEGAFPDADTLARAWLGFIDGEPPLAPDDGIRVAPRHFTLAAIEAGEAVNAAANNGFMDPKDVAWWSHWDYPGNPYRGAEALKKRAFVMAAADMMMQDEEHEQGRNRRSDDAPNDQWAWLSRDFAIAMLDDLALSTVWARTSLPTEAVMRDTIRSRLEKRAGPEPSAAAPAPWKEVHWSRTLPFAHDLYRPGSYARWVALEAAGSPLTRPVYGREDRFIRDLNGGGEFLAVRFDRYAAVVHTGAIAKTWASGVSGKSGGSLSTFWTPAAGSVLTGRCRATQSQAPDEWTDADDRGPSTWAVHAITGRGAGGDFFSSSRIRDLHSEYRIESDTRAVVTVSGDLGGSLDADPADALKGANRYTREFALDATGIAVSSRLALGPDDAVAELWEILPLHVGPGKAAADVAVRSRGEWRPITTAAEVADAIRVTRYGEETLILLDAPRRLRAERDTPRGFSGMDIRNVMIDLLPPTDGQAAVSYRITTGP